MKCVCRCVSILWMCFAYIDEENNKGYCVEVFFTLSIVSSCCTCDITDDILLFDLFSTKNWTDLISSFSSDSIKMNSQARSNFSVTYLIEVRQDRKWKFGHFVEFSPFTDLFCFKNGKKSFNRWKSNKDDYKCQIKKEKNDLSAKPHPNPTFQLFFSSRRC